MSLFVGDSEKSGFQQDGATICWQAMKCLSGLQAASAYLWLSWSWSLDHGLDLLFSKIVLKASIHDEQSGPGQKTVQ